jgi:hypothetical protein
VLGALVAVMFLSVAAKRAHAARASEGQLRSGLVAAEAAIARLTVPDSTRVESSCAWFRCFKAARSSHVVARTIPSLLQALGAHTSGIDEVFRLKHVSFGCATVDNRRLGPLTTCSYPAVLDGHLVIVFLGPYSPANHSRQRIPLATTDYAMRHDSELDIALGCGTSDSTQFDTPSQPCSK